MGFISLTSLILLFQTLHSVAVFKFACSIMLSLIPLFYLISIIKDKENKIILISFIFLASLSGFEFFKTTNNSLYVYKYKKDENYKNDYFDYFKGQKWSEQLWSHLIFLDKNLINIKSKCKIKHAANLSEAGLYAVILRKHFKVTQLLPWYENKDKGWQNVYYNALWSHFDPEEFNVIINNLEKNNTILIASRENFPFLRLNNKKIRIDDKMYFINLPYSYQHKNKVIILPKNCYL